MTLDATHAPDRTGAPPPSSAKPPAPRGRFRSFVSRHPLLTALYAVLSFIGLLILAIIIFLWLANWNMLRGPIGRFASAQTHRHIELDGDLKVHLLTWTPTVTIGGVKIGNPQWAGPGDTADVENIIVSVKLLPLLGFHVVMPLLEFDKPVVNLYRDASGRQNWDVDTGKPKPNAKPFKLPPIEQFVVNDGRLKYIDREAQDEHHRGDRLQRARPGSAGARLQPARRRVAQQPALPPQGGGRPADPCAAQPALPPSRATSRRRTPTSPPSAIWPRPFDMNDVVSDVHMSGRDLANLYYVTGLALPNTPPLRHQGRALAQGPRVRLRQGRGPGGRQRPWKAP